MFPPESKTLHRKSALRCRIAAGVTGLAATLVLLRTLGSVAIFWYASERILFFLPSLATPVRLEEMVRNPERFSGKWVKVQGRIVKPADDEAYLLPSGQDNEPAAVGDAGVKPILQSGLYMHNFGLSESGVRSLSAVEAPRNTFVTIVGEFEAATPTFVPHLDAVAITDPPQSQFRRGMTTRLLTDLSTLLVEAALLFGSFWLFIKAGRMNV